MEKTPSAAASAAEDADWVTTILRRRSRAEEEEGYEKLMRKYWKLVNVLAVSKLGDPREAEDVSQEAFIRAFRSLDRLAKPVAFLGWLLQITRNLVTDHLRARRPHVSLDALGEAPVESGASTTSRPRFERRLEESEEIELVLDALESLPEPYREVVALKYLKELDGKTMAHLLGEPEGTVRNRLFRAIEKLRANLESRGVKER